MVLSHSEIEGKPSSISAALDRRFEAVVFDWDGTGVPDRTADAARVRAAVEQLCTLGMDVFIVSGTHVGNVDGQLRARPVGQGRLFLCLNRGSEVFAVGAEGVERIRARVASPEEDVLLDEAARLTIERLGAMGLRAEVVSSRLNRRKIDLIPEPRWIDPPKAIINELLVAVEDRLRAAGLERLRDAVDVAMQAARDAGLSDPRITSDAKHIEIGLTDKADSARWIFEELWRVGIGPAMVLIGGDEFGRLGGLVGSDSMMLVPEAAGATVISVGVEPDGVPKGVLGLGGGPDAFLAVLDDQIRRRVHQEVPDVLVDRAWSLSIHGLDLEKERAREALLTVADGVIGTSGAPAARHGATTPEVIAADLYAGDGPETELVRAPVWNVLPYDMDAVAGVRRTLDFRAGILRQELVEPEGTVKTFAFSSLARPGVVVFRAQGPAALLRGGSILHGDGASGGDGDGRTWMSVEAKPGGLAVAAAETRRNGSPIVEIQRVGAYVVDARSVPGVDDAVKKLTEAEEAGFETLLAEHRRAWAARWAEADVVIDGDADLQQAVRLGLFHLMSSVLS